MQHALAPYAIIVKCRASEEGVVRVDAHTCCCRWTPLRPGHHSHALNVKTTPIDVILMSVGTSITFGAAVVEHTIVRLYEIPLVRVP